MPDSALFKRSIALFAIAFSAILMVMGSSGEFSSAVSNTDGRADGSGPENLQDKMPMAETAILSSHALPYRLFPEAFSGKTTKQDNQRMPFGPGIAVSRGISDQEDGLPARVPVLAGSQVLAFYGKPGAPSMGILGEYSKETLAPILEAYAKLYDEANGPMGVVPALYLIYGTCWPEGEIGILKKDIVEAYIEFAGQKGWLVFLDHQLGKYGVEESVKAMLPFLKYPNVHLAIDPEWRTLKPMQEIGSINGSELNNAQSLMDDYLNQNGLPGIRMLVVHQFKPSMIRESSVVRADFDRVIPVHTADGFGIPEVKRNAYAINVKSKNMPVKGFKLFFESKVPGAGWDKPLMLPSEVISLEPMPLLIIYQ